MATQTAVGGNAADDVRQLADLSSRRACPKCSGFGFLHSAIDKHDRPTNLRCKKCVDCKICEGSGVTVGLLGCKKCNARGFVHSSKAKKPHYFPEHARCSNCEKCRDCNGQGVIDKSHLQEFRRTIAAMKRSTVLSGSGTAGTFATMTQINNRNTLFSLSPNVLTLPPMVPDLSFLGERPKLLLNPSAMHPHMAGILGFPIDESVYEAMMDVSNSMNAVELLRKDSIDTSKQQKQPEEPPIPCPKCEGKGFRHDNASKHDKKKKEKCKNCTVCKACSGTGTVVGKKPCETCEMRGFVHGSAEREHDVPKTLRCFFCKDCPSCHGVGLISTAASITGISMSASSSQASISTMSSNATSSMSTGMRPVLRRPEDRLSNSVTQRASYT